MLGLGRLAAQAAQGFFHNGPVASRFDEHYTCFPVTFASKEDLEKGNKILLPPSALDHLARLNITWPMLFELHNAEKGRHTCGGVQEFSAEEGTCYMPYWMMQNLLLKEGDIVRVTNTTLPKGRYVKLQPVSKEFLDISNPKAVLEASLRLYATLTVGDNIVIHYNQKKYEIEIVECRPSNSISIIETDVEVDFAPPKDYVEPSPPPTPSPVPSLDPFAGSNGGGEAPPAKKEDVLFGGTGVRLDGKPVKPKKNSPAPTGVSPNRPIAIPDDDDETDEEPWLKAIPGGVRVSCKATPHPIYRPRVACLVSPVCWCVCLSGGLVV